MPTFHVLIGWDAKGEHALLATSNDESPVGPTVPRTYVILKLDPDKLFQDEEVDQIGQAYQIDQIDCYRNDDGKLTVEGKTVKSCEWKDVAPHSEWPKVKFSRHGTPVAKDMARVQGDERYHNCHLRYGQGDSAKRVVWLPSCDTLQETRRMKDTLFFVLHHYDDPGGLEVDIEYLIRMPAADAEKKSTPERLTRLLKEASSARSSSRKYGLYRTAAGVGTIPGDQIIDAMRAAESADRHDLGARWWKRTAGTLDDADKARLLKEIAEDSGLTRTRRKLK